MNIQNLHIAKVISNDDLSSSSSGREGKIKIFIESIMSEWKDEHLPWARPFNNGFGGSSDFGVLNIPEEDSLVWVFAEKPNNFKNWYYLADVSLKKLNPIRKILTFLTGKFKLSFSAKGLGLSSSYPDVKLTYYKNGIVIGVSNDSSNPEIFVYHPQTAMIVIDKDGKIKSRSSEWQHYGNIIVKEGDVTITKGNFTIEEGDSEVTKGELIVGKDITWNNETTATKASTHTHPTTSPGAPTGAPTPGS